MSTVFQGRLYCLPGIQVLDRDIDSSDCSGFYRMRLDGSIRYVDIAAGVFNDPYDILLQLPIADLRNLKEPWTNALVIKAGHEVRGVKIEPYAVAIKGWHDVYVEQDSLETVRSLNERVDEVKYGSGFAIAKRARFDIEIPSIKQETLLYKVLHGCHIGPRFLGHLTEGGRIRGLLIEKVEGSHAGIDDYDACEAALQNLHSTGWLMGDTNRHNFIVSDSDVKSVTLIDFEAAKAITNPILPMEELGNLKKQLMDDSGKGGGWQKMK